MGKSIRNKKLMVTFNNHAENGQEIHLEVDMSKIPDWKIEVQDKQFGMWCFPRITRGNYRYNVYGNITNGEPTADNLFVTCTMFGTHLGNMENVKVREIYT